MNQGQIVFDGEVNKAVDYYVSPIMHNHSQEIIVNDKEHRDREQSKDVEFVKVEMLNNDINNIATDEPIQIKIILKKNNMAIKKATFGTHFLTLADECVGTTISPVISLPDKEDIEIAMRINHHNLAIGNYKIDFNIGLKEVALGAYDFDVIHNVCFFTVNFKTIERKDSYAYWLPKWGHHYNESVDYTIK